MSRRNSSIAEMRDPLLSNDVAAAIAATEIGSDDSVCVLSARRRRYVELPVAAAAAAL